MAIAFDVQQAELEGARKQNDRLEHRLDNANREISALEEDLSELQNRIGDGGWGPLQWETITDPDSNWFKLVAKYTYFPTVEANEAFLESLNKRSWPGDDGILTRLRSYQKVTAAERHGRKPPEPSGGGRPGAPRQIVYHDQWLIYCLFVRAGFSMIMLRLITDIAVSYISDIISTWAVFLDQSFAKLFTNPTRSQLLKCYPETFIRKFGHARVVMLRPGGRWSWRGAEG